SEEPSSNQGVSLRGSIAGNCMRELCLPSLCSSTILVVCTTLTLQCTGELDSTRELAIPTDLSASAVSPSEIDLRWTDNSTHESGFEVERASSSSGPWAKIGTTPADVSAYMDVALESSKTYSYRVRASSASRVSEYSNIATAMTSGELSACGDSA